MVISILAAVFAWWLASAGPATVFRIVFDNSTSIGDYKHFPGRTLLPSASAFRFKEDVAGSTVPTTVSYGARQDVPLDEGLKSNDTVAFLVVMTIRCSSSATTSGTRFLA
jgi:hypothetical protein